MTSEPLVFCLTCLLLGQMAPPSVLTSSPLHLKSSFITAAPGGEVTLRCSYEGDESAWICWYKQTLGQNPKLISSFFVYSLENVFYGEFENNSRFTLIRKKQTTNLIISNLKMSDSATYYCAFAYAQIVSFSEGATVIIKDPGSDIRPSVLQSEPESVRPGDTVTLNCSVQTGSCGGEQSIYWLRKSEESHPGLIYTHGGKRDRCERNTNTPTHTCVYSLPLKDLTVSDAGTYYCVVSSSGQIVFGNGTRLTLMIYRLKNKHTNQAAEPRILDPTSSTTTEQGTSQPTASLHYSSVDVNRFSRSRRKMSSN
ncbi:Down syndrome cell adhesion molecule homolog isoform X2 [Poecilia reticulata]|uniref:Down syndrome cell adhesion molecule homolog isoform X2 n=1 Tax=Poecilia reticulata TaxID=8081 RepID=UPI0007EAA6DC|nr:PREDICTED: Down syndrome cell adhesion molecule homolog isoform X2 [Poecilia reticulata]